MTKTLSQTQIIRSLAQALEWFEQEIGWGVPAGELNHLTGRIGELYAAMVTRGQMALETNQRGYDVVSIDGERISVKTITTSTHVRFRGSTFDQVDRVMVLRLVVDDDVVSIQELLDCSAENIRAKDPGGDGNYIFYIGKTADGGPEHEGKRLESVRKLPERGSAEYGDYRVVQYESGTVLVEQDGEPLKVAKPVLREIAKKIGVSIYNSADNMKNTRSLGADIIRELS